MDRRSDSGMELDREERRGGVDRRERPRRRTVLAARVLHDPQGRQSCDLRLRDISSDGARAVQTGPEPLPKDGVLIVPSLGEAHAYHVTWAQAGQAGLAFDKSWDLKPAEVEPEARGFKRLWAELAAR